MDVTSDKSVDPKTGIVLRDKNGPSGIVDLAWKRAQAPNYQHNLELYRRQLWRGNLRQELPYPTRQKLSKALFNQKLMKYAQRAGYNYNTIFDNAPLHPHDLLIGWAGKKLKNQMREKGRIHIGRKRRPVHRTVLKSIIHYMSLAHRFTIFQCVPAVELEPVTIQDLKQIIDCRNGNTGSLQFLDSNLNVVHKIQYVRDKTVPEAEIINRWANLTIPRTRPGNEGDIRPLFRNPAIRNRAPAEKS